MDKISSHFDFLAKLVKSNPSEAEELLKNASSDEKQAVLACLSYRKVIKDKPLNSQERKIITYGLRSRRLTTFFKKYRRVVLGIIVCSLSRLVQEAFFYVCES